MKKIINKLGQLFYKISHPTYLYIWLFKRKTTECKGKLYVGTYSLITSNTKVYLGNNVNFNGIRILGRGECHIGDNFHSGTECLIMTDYHNYDKGSKIPYDETFIIENVIIKDNVWLGNRVIILPGVTIGEGAIIQAGSVVVKNIPPLAIAGGHPAVVFKYRNEEHYYALKESGNFF